MSSSGSDSRYRRRTKQGGGRSNRQGVPEPDKHELQGELIAFRVLQYEPEYPTRYGPKPRVVVLLHVLTGPLSGEQFADWWVVGPIAEQMADASPRHLTGARVVTRISASHREYVAIDLLLNTADQRVVSEYAAWLSQSARRLGR